MVALPQTIDEVIYELDTIIQDAVSKNNYNAIFAYVYKRTTIEIKRAIEKNYFYDNPGMEIFDVYFANLYITAYRDYCKNLPVSGCWQIALDAGKNKLTYMQHVLLGMNAHINFDLGITAAYYADKNNIDNIEEIKNDFIKVNNLLFSLVDEIQDRLARVSPMLFVIDVLGGRYDERYSFLSIEKARKISWKFAKKLWHKEEEYKLGFQKKMDGKVAKLASIIASPKFFLLKLSIRFVGAFEKKKIGDVLQALERHYKPNLFS